jgi:hypothetical protein
MRFGRHHAEADEPIEVEPAPARPVIAALTPWRTTERELFVRHARKDGRLVAVLRTVDKGTSCVVEAEVHPHDSAQALRPGPYTFPDAHQAGAFVTEAVAALMYLGCDVQAE